MPKTRYSDGIPTQIRGYRGGKNPATSGNFRRALRAAAPKKQSKLRDISPGRGLFAGNLPAFRERGLHRRVMFNLRDGERGESLKLVFPVTFQRPSAGGRRGGRSYQFPGERAQLPFHLDPEKLVFKRVAELISRGTCVFSSCERRTCHFPGERTQLFVARAPVSAEIHTRETMFRKEVTPFGRRGGGKAEISRWRPGIITLF